MKYDLSVIIPVYNGEQYIKKCIDSILKNNINLEIIIINDGSTDNTKKILNTYKNIKIITKKHKNVASARNKGLNQIQGKYFTFVDIDDYIESEMYHELIKNALKNDLDICGCNYYEIYNSKTKSKYKYDGKIRNNEETIKQTLKDQISLVVWDKIYKTETYKNIKFNEKLDINEDYLYTLTCLLKANKTQFINKYYYNYIKHNNSLTTTYKLIDIKNNDYNQYLDINLIKTIKKYPEYEFYKNNQELKKIHMYSKCIDKNCYEYLKKYIDKNKLKNLLKYKISKSTKVEIIIYLLNEKIHLFLFPLYIKLKNKIRKPVTK